MVVVCCKMSMVDDSDLVQSEDGSMVKERGRRLDIIG